MENEITKPKVKLTGENGNAFVILAACVKAARKAGWSTQMIREFRDKAMAADYDSLLRTCMEYFEVS
jgi:hypothetical protein